MLLLLLLHVTDWSESMLRHGGFFLRLLFCWRQNRMMTTVSLLLFCGEFLRLCDFVLLNKSGRKEESTIQLKRAQAKQATCSLFCCGLVLSFFPDGTRQFREKFCSSTPKQFFLLILLSTDAACRNPLLLTSTMLRSYVSKLANWFGF